MQILEGNVGFCFDKKLDSYDVNKTFITAAIPITLPVDLDQARKNNALAILKDHLTFIPNAFYPI